MQLTQTFNFFFFPPSRAALHSMWDLSSANRDQAHIPCIGTLES